MRMAALLTILSGPVLCVQTHASKWAKMLASCRKSSPSLWRACSTSVAGRAFASGGSHKQGHTKVPVPRVTKLLINGKVS